MALIEVSKCLINEDSFDLLADYFESIKTFKEHTQYDTVILSVTKKGIANGDVPYMLLLQTQEDGSSKIIDCSPELNRIGKWSMPMFSVN